MGSYRHYHRKVLLLQRKKCAFLYGTLKKASVFFFPTDNSVSLVVGIEGVKFTAMNIYFECVFERDNL